MMKALNLSKNDPRLDEDAQNAASNPGPGGFSMSDYDKKILEMAKGNKFSKKKQSSSIKESVHENS